MRTTITFSDDVTAAIEAHRRRTGKGVSEAVNDLVRAGLIDPGTDRPFVQETSPMGMRMNVDNIGEVLETLERHG